MISRTDFPRLTEHNHRVTSPESVDYNCIAWSVKDTERWWQPGVYWPTKSQSDDYGLGILVEAFRSLGFEECDDGTLENGYEKVALYGSTFLYTHAARQLLNGNWTSKLGRSEDIEHDTPDDLAGGVYGEVRQYMRRAIRRT
jgi:hypothetical protein